MNQLNELLNIGLARKIHAATNLNSSSSRSHSIFKIIVQLPSHSGEVEEYSLSIVDLAGSEKVSRSETSGKEFRETCNINQSLSTLTRCLKNMSFNSKYTNVRKPIPYRDSELTKLFMEYFQSGQNISMIVNINPSKEDLTESLNVLNYACLSREIKPARCRVITNNTNFSNQKKKVKNNDHRDNKDNKQVFTSDLSDFSEEDNSYFKNNINTSIVFTNNPNIISTPMKFASAPQDDNLILNEKIKELQKQNEEMRMSFLRSNYEQQIANLSLKNELMSMIANQWTHISTLPYSNSFLRALESRNSLQEPQVNYLPNPFMTTPKKRMSYHPELQSERINSFVINLEKIKRSTITRYNEIPHQKFEERENIILNDELSNNIQEEEKQDNFLQISKIENKIEVNENNNNKKRKNRKKPASKISFIDEEENESTAEQEEDINTNTTVSDLIEKKIKIKSKSLDKSVSDEETVSLEESKKILKEESKFKKKNTKKSKLVNEEIQGEDDDTYYNKSKQTNYSIILEEEKEQERNSLSNQKKKPKKTKSRKKKNKN